jgi:GH24 family phage-related lysozyme (muramidase)
MAMTAQEWTAEVRRRIAVNEGCRLRMYYDTVGIPTIAYGFNLQNANAKAILQKAGVTDIAGVISGATSLTQAQADSTFDQMLPHYVNGARGTLASGVFGKLSDARRFVVVDMTYNLGVAGWMGFPSARAAINAAVAATDAPAKKAQYNKAADQMKNSAWYSQVGNRAKRNVAMMRSSGWVDPNGDGSS